MQFTGQITNIQEQSGTNRYGEPYHGVNLTVIEPIKEDGSWNNKTLVYVPDASASDFKKGESVTVECNLDVKIAQSGKTYTSLSTKYINTKAF